MCSRINDRDRRFADRELSASKRERENDMKTWKATGCVLLAGIFWGSMGLFVRQLNAAGLYAIDVMQLRVLASAISVGLYLLLFDRQKLRLRPRDIWCFAGSGICSLMLFSWCYFTGMQAASLAVMAVLLYTVPVFVMLMSIVFFREKLTGAKLTALVLCLAGCVLVFVPSVGLFYLSDIMGGGLVLVGNLIRGQLLKVRDWNVGSAMSMVLIALSAGIYLLYRKVGGDALGVM